MPYNRFVREDISALRSEVKHLQLLVKEDQLLKQAGEQFYDDPVAAELLFTFSERIDEQTERIEAVLEDITFHSDPENRAFYEAEDMALYLGSTTQVLAAEIENVEAVLMTKQQMSSSQSSAGAGTQAGQSGVIQKAISWIKQRVVPILKSIMAKAWKLLSGLLTPKEWKVKGGTGISFLGLLNAELEITFGP